MSMMRRKCGNCGRMGDQAEMHRRKYHWRCARCEAAAKTSPAEREAFGRERTEANQQRRKATLTSEPKQTYGFEVDR